MTTKTVPLTLVIILSIVLSVGQFFIPSFGKNKSILMTYLPAIIRVLLFIYIVQLSMLVHKLAVAYSSTEGEINVPGLFYVPFIGFIKSNDVYAYINTTHTNTNTNTNTSPTLKKSTGLTAQIIYLIIMVLIFFIKTIQKWQLHQFFI
jgi:hypothetical protein